MRRVAWFHVVIDCESEAVVNAWLTTVVEGLNAFAREAEKKCDGRLTIVQPMESGQSIPVVESAPAEREDI